MLPTKKVLTRNLRGSERQEQKYIDGHDTAATAAAPSQSNDYSNETAWYIAHHPVSILLEMKSALCSTSPMYSTVVRMSPLMESSLRAT